jgi:hypothetical protein
MQVRLLRYWILMPVPNTFSSTFCPSPLPERTHYQLAKISVAPLVHLMFRPIFVLVGGISRMHIVCMLECRGHATEGRTACFDRWFLSLLRFNICTFSFLVVVVTIPQPSLCGAYMPFRDMVPDTWRARTDAHSTAGLFFLQSCNFYCEG